MTIVSKLSNIISTRELAWIIWILIAFTRCLFSKEIRLSLGGVIKSLLVWKLLVSIFAFLLHTAFCVFVLFKFGLWNSAFLKDTLIWTLGFGFISLMNVNEAKDSKYFQQMLFEAIKWTIAIEFMVNFFTFSLLKELIIVPIIILSVVMQVFASKKPEHKTVEKFFTYILTGLGIYIFCFSFYKTICQYNQFFTPDNLKAILLPVFLSISFLPFMYLYNLIVKYEVLWVRLNLSIRDKHNRRRVKYRILWVANVNIDRLSSISNNIFKPINLYNDFSYEMVKAVSKGEYINTAEREG